MKRKCYFFNFYRKTKREVQTQEAKNWADERGMLFLETSSMLDINVDLAFNNMTHQVLQKIKYNKLDPTKEAGISVYYEGQAGLRQQENKCQC